MSADATPAAPAVVAPAPTHLLKPLKVGNIEVKNRVWMAPLTRCRAEMPGHVPGALIAEMYEQRATSGLLIAEATMITADSSGFYTEPGCYNEAQVAGWKLTTDAVHRAGGKIYLQIVHCGRQAHPSNNNGVQPVAPSAIAVPDHKVAAQHNPTGEPVPYVEPRELSDAEVVEIVAAFAHSAKLAIQAGFDGVEIHAANGYLIAQFLAAHANKRTSGPYANTSIETRAKFLLDIVQACAAAVGGADKLGVRISPVNHYGQGAWVDPEADTAYVASHLDALGVGYLHIMRASFFPPFAQIDLIALCRQHFQRVLVSNMGYEPDTAEQEVASGRVDAIAFGRPFISNPDLVHRIAKQIPLAPSDHTTYYTHGAKGYTDYPVASA